MEINNKDFRPSVSDEINVTVESNHRRMSIAATLVGGVLAFVLAVVLPIPGAQNHAATEDYIDNLAKQHIEHIDTLARQHIKNHIEEHI